jgi:phenylacetate-CoA ligase
MTPSDQLPIQTIEDQQFLKFKAHLEEAAAHSAYYSKTFQELGIKPSDINSWQDMARLPILHTATLLAQNADFPAVPKSRQRRVIVSGGTTGTPKTCYVGDNLREIIRVWADVWHATELTADDVVVVMCPLPLASGLVITEIVEEIGCTSIPVGLTTPPEFVAKLMQRLEATVIVTQPSTLQAFAQQIRKHGYEPKDFKIRKVLLGSEVLTKSIRKQVETEWNCEVFDTSGSSEVGMIGAECREHDGHHLATGSAYFDVVGLETGQSVREGLGQLYVCTLMNSGLPLLRYDMKDIVRITREPCKCGRTTPRLWFMGRADDRLVFKTGVKFYAYQVDDALASFEQLTPAYNVIATGDEKRDHIKVVLEVRDPAQADEKLKQTVVQAIITSSVDFNEIYDEKLIDAPEVEFVAPGTLERTPRGKIKNRFRDLRPASQPDLVL